MTIHEKEQEILLKSLFENEAVTKEGLANALMRAGADSLSPLPLKHAVRAGMVSLARKFKNLDIVFCITEVGGPDGTLYTITEEADDYISANLTHPILDENGTIIGLRYSLPSYSKPKKGRYLNGI
tara:strand:- start:4030 stop:4407 length:378 start_codon:yes stop_codon:yes gene_type:complete